MQVGWLGDVESAFSGTGIKSFVLEGALGELQVRTSITVIGQSIEPSCLKIHFNYRVRIGFPLPTKKQQHQITLRYGNGV